MIDRNRQIIGRIQSNRVNVVKLARPLVAGKSKRKSPGGCLTILGLERGGIVCDSLQVTDRERRAKGDSNASCQGRDQQSLPRNDHHDHEEVDAWFS